MPAHRALAILVLAASTASPQDLGDDIVIESERGALGEAPGGAPRVEVLIDNAMPLGKSVISVRVQGFALQDVEEAVVTVDGKEVARLAAPPFDVEHDFGDVPVRHEIVATVRRAGGGELRGSRVTQAPATAVMKTIVDVVEVSVIVKDAEGNRIRDLARDEFTVLEDGAPQAIQDFVRERTPLSLVMVLDSSGSMEGRLWSLKKAASEFVRKVDADVPIQVVDFDHEVRLEQEMTLDREKAVAAIQRLEEGGGTHLWDAAYGGAFALSGKEGRRAVVLFTDGVDQSTEDDERRVVQGGLDEVIGMARKERVQFYCIGFGRKIDEETLSRMSSETGGVFYRAESAKEFRQVYDAILADVAAQYVLTYSPARRRDGSVHHIEVRVARPGLTPIHRKSYVATP